MKENERHEDVRSTLLFCYRKALGIFICKDLSASPGVKFGSVLAGILHSEFLRNIRIWISGKIRKNYKIYTKSSFFHIVVEYRVPFYFIISMATHDTSEIYRGEFLVFGNKLTENMNTIIQGGFLRYYWNSIYTALLSTMLCLVISLMASYALTVYRFKSRNFITSFIVTSMMIPGQISLLGYTVEMRNFGLMNTHWPLVFTWAASAYSVYFITQFMKSSLPMELVESASIDGCGELRTFSSIAIPIVKPAIGTQFMLTFLWSWNNFMMPSTVLTDSKMFTLPLGIQTLATAYTQDWGARGAALALAVLPMLIIFACGSKYFIKGLAAGAVKG